MRAPARSKAKHAAPAGYDLESWFAGYEAGLLTTSSKPVRTPPQTVGVHDRITTDSSDSRKIRRGFQGKSMNSSGVCHFFFGGTPYCSMLNFVNSMPDFANNMPDHVKNMPDVCEV